MAKFDFDKPVASFSWYLQNGSADDKRGNRLHVGTGQNAQIYFDPKSGEFIGKLKYVDDYIDLADGAKQHFELPRTAREYKPSDFSPKFPISNVKFEVDESVKDFIHVLPRGLFFYQNEFYDPVHGIYIESKVNGMGDVPHFTLYDVSVADIEECMAWGIKHLDEVPRQIHVVNGSPTSRQSTLRVQMTVESMTLSTHFAKTVAGAMSRNSMRKRSPVSMKSLQRRTALKRVS